MWLRNQYLSYNLFFLFIITYIKTQEITSLVYLDDWLIAPVTCSKLQDSETPKLRDEVPWWMLKLLLGTWYLNFSVTKSRDWLATETFCGWSMTGYFELWCELFSQFSRDSFVCFSDNSKVVQLWQCNLLFFYCCDHQQWLKSDGRITSAFRPKKQTDQMSTR